MSLDDLIVGFDRALRTLTGSAVSARPYPAETVPPAELEEADRRHAGGLMRVNHAGEVCAQALYAGQALTAGNDELKGRLQRAAQEETEHLAWTERRLTELGARTSALDPLWFAGSFAIGAVAGWAGDRWNLGFLSETERQVEAHLSGHLDKLPEHDQRSRAIVEQMRIDEAGHAQMAEESGGAPLPLPARALMRLTAKVMTSTAYRI